MGPTTARRVTGALIVITAVALSAWDLFAAAAAGDSGTISRVILDNAHHWPEIPFGFGLLSGHLFFGQGQP